MAEFAVAICVGLSAGLLWLLQFILGFGLYGFVLVAVFAAAVLLRILYRTWIARRCLKSVRGMKQERLIRYYFGQFSLIYNLSYVISTSVYEILLCANQSMKFYKISKESVENGLAKRNEDYFFRTILSWNKFLAAVRFNVGYRKRMAERTSLSLVNEKIKDSVENREVYEEFERKAAEEAERGGRLKGRTLAGLDTGKRIAYMFRRNVARMDRLSRKCAVYEAELQTFNETVVNVESDIKAVSRMNKSC